MIGTRILGVKQTILTFTELPQTVQNTGMRKGLNAAGGVIRDAAVANTPRASGLLRRSLKVKVRIPNASYNTAHHGRPAYAVIGPARRVAGVVHLTSKGFRTTTAPLGLAEGGGLRALGKRKITVAVRRKPSRYAHLVEKGTKRGGLGVYFLTRARASHGEAAKAKMILKIHEHIHGWALARSARLNSVAA